MSGPGMYVYSDTTSGTAIFADQLGWFWGVNVGIYGIHGVSGVF